MRAIKSLLVMVVVVGLVATMGARSFAGPLMPPFPSVWNPGDAVAGQSTLHPRPGDIGEPITVDWIVVFWGNVGGKPVWGYYYQLENPETQPHPAKTIAALTISTLGGPPFFAADFIKDQSLDVDFTDIGPVLGHTSTNYANLAGEFEPVPGNLQNPTSSPDLSPYDVTFHFGPPFVKEIAVGNQSVVLTAYAYFPPTYGGATAQNTDVQWKGLVPVPSPEPSAVVLLTMGLIGCAAIYRRRK